jgi:hypothetical protein
MTDHPVAIIILGFFLLVIGWMLPFLMLLHILPSTFFLNFFAYLLMLLGLILGIVGSALYVRLRKK